MSFPESAKPVIFISYAHADQPEKPAADGEQWLSFVLGFLRPAVKDGIFYLDDQMADGANWEEKIEDKLSGCDIFILLVSPSSMAAEIVDREIAIVRQRRVREGLIHFYALLVRPTPGSELTKIMDFNLRPQNVISLSALTPREREQHMLSVANEIAEIAERIAERKRAVPDVEAIPAQATSAIQFAPDEEGRFDLVPDPPDLTPRTDTAQREHYEETRHKASDLADLGRNRLGDIAGSVERFLAALPERIEEASISRLWSRGNTLRRRLKASDAAPSDPGDSSRLSPLVAEMLRDLVETYNVFIVGDPSGRELDEVRIGPQERDSGVSIVEAAAPIVSAVTESERIATPAAREALKEQLEAAASAPPGIDGDQAIALAQKTSGNFIAELLRSAYAPVRKLIAAGKGEAGFAWKEIRAGAYRAAGPAAAGAAALYHQELIAFVIENADKLKSFAAQAFHNPALGHIIDLIVKFAK